MPLLCMIVFMVCVKQINMFLILINMEELSVTLRNIYTFVFIIETCTHAQETRRH